MQLKEKKEAIFTSVEAEQLKWFMLVADLCNPEKCSKEYFFQTDISSRWETTVSYDIVLGEGGYKIRSCTRPVGMWISPDPMRQFHGLYSYTGNGTNPINGFDPDGNKFNQAGDNIYRTAVQNDFWGSNTLRSQLTASLISDQLFEVVPHDGDGNATIDGKIYLSKNSLGGFEGARLLNHETRHVKGETGRIWHNSLDQVDQKAGFAMSFFQFLKFNRLLGTNEMNEALGPKNAAWLGGPDNVYENDMDIYLEADQFE
jgi:hypothetical protein